MPLSRIRCSPQRISKSFLLFMNFSSSAALRAAEFTEESSTCEAEYVELHGRMRGFASRGQLGRALQTLDFMKKLSGKPTVHDFNALIYSYLKSGNVVAGQLVEVYHGMKRSGPAPNALTYNALFNGMVTLVYLKAAYLIAQQMCASDFIPSFTSISKLLKKSLELGHLDHSFDVLGLMLRLKFQPTVHTIDSFITQLNKVGRIEEACHLLYDLFLQGYVCCARSCNPILWALCKSGKSYDALQFSYLMKKRGIVLNDCSYTALIYGFFKEGLRKEACCCWRNMQSDGCKPNVITYTVMLKFLLDRGNKEGALEVFARMEDERCDLDIYICNIIIRELCCQGRIANAIEIWEAIEVFGQKGIEPDSYTYSALVGGLVKAGMGRIALGLFDDLISKGCSLDLVMYKILFHCLYQEKEFEDALSLKSAIEGGSLPNNVYMILIGVCKEGNVRNVDS